MGKEVFILGAVFAPCAGAFILPGLGRISCRLRNAGALLLACASFACALCLIPQAASGQRLIFFRHLPLGLNLSFCADGLAVFMACVSSLVSAIVVFYSFGYIRRYPHQGEYYLFVLLFLGAMMGLIFSANLILLYFF
jgi:NADH:ubiquinone oxidoreductase subunit 5 (subunit L)/multisubunit Na+/H+ antiporter MnhA subunit